MAETNERTRLLPQGSLAPRSASSSGMREIIGLLQTAIPISASFALQNIVQALSIILAGSIGPDQLDITSYGFMFATCTGSMVSIGGSTALDTLCGQAVTSSKTLAQPTILGRHLQRSLFILSIIYLAVITPIWLISGKIFVALGQEQQFALGTGRFLIFMLPGGYFQLVGECLKKYSQIQGQSNVVGKIVFLATVVGILANIVLIKVMDFGTYSAPVAFLICQLGTVGPLAVLMARKERQRQTLKMIHSWPELLDGMGTNLFLAITGILTIATEWWSFEILAIMAAKLRPQEVSAQSILMSADLIFTTISLGIGVATSHRIAHILGANEPQLARKAAIPPYLLSCSIGAVEFILIYVSRSQLGYLFTKDSQVVATTSHVLPFMAIFQVLDLSNGAAGGILRGARRNHLSGVCNLFAYYGVGLTTAWALCFRTDWGLVGLWVGIIIGSGVLLLLQTVCVLLLPWQKAAKEASGET